MDEVARDIQNPRWRSTSVEFCGGTHVRTTGDIKQLVLLEESGIAKGIRRLIAVTGDEAHEAGIRASELESRVDALGKMTDFRAKDAALKVFQSDLQSAEIGTVRKERLRVRSTAIRKEHDEQAKQADKLAAKRITDASDRHFAEQPNSKAFFGRFEANAKVRCAVLPDHADDTGVQHGAAGRRQVGQGRVSVLHRPGRAGQSPARQRPAQVRRQQVLYRPRLARDRVRHRRRQGRRQGRHGQGHRLRGRADRRGARGGAQGVCGALRAVDRARDALQASRARPVL